RDLHSQLRRQRQMCIRDRYKDVSTPPISSSTLPTETEERSSERSAPSNLDGSNATGKNYPCLLYTSDAADEV
ncbi:hypothetical protein KQJ29_37510, partial [Enterococcus sp. S181_ASV_20]|nr:hypothetical protein [Enterococcus sp. S181_ASV_20]